MMFLDFERSHFSKAGRKNGETGTKHRFIVTNKHQIQFGWQRAEFNMNTKFQFRFRHLKTAVKIYILVGIGVLLLGISTLLSYSSIREINQSTEVIFNHNLTSIIWLKQIQVIIDRQMPLFSSLWPIMTRGTINV